MDVDEVAARIGMGSEKPTTTGWRMRCPAHEDSKPSLDVSEGRDGRVLVICRAGCELDAVLIASRLDWNDLFTEDSKRRDDDGTWSPAGRIEATYDYTDEGCKLLFQVVRAEGKKFLQRRPDPIAKSGWTWKLGDARRPLYRLPEVVEAVTHGVMVYVVEGERDVETVRRTGAVATCNSGGAGKWRPEHAESLRDAHVVVVADRDEPGHRHARAVVKSLRGVAADLRLTQPLAGKDVSDHLAAGHSLDELSTLSAGEAAAVMAEDVLDFIKGESGFDWVVEGLLERQDRLILTGFEGFGKTTLMRQMAVCFAAGIHPFKFHAIPPARVLMVDCENGERLTRRRLQTLIATAEESGPFPRDQLYVVNRPGGLDLTTEEGEWLFEQVNAFKPDVTFIGPLYQLHFEDPNAEQPTRRVAQVLRDIAVQGKCALITEAHAGKAESGGGHRHVRPIGSSVWLRWPEFGYGLEPIKDSHELTFKGWRGPRDEREWPDRVERWSPWPWRGIYGRSLKQIVTRPVIAPPFNEPQRDENRFKPPPALPLDDPEF